MERRIIQTEDGSTSLYVPELDEHYHSVHGAVQESMHVFIKAGLSQLSNDNLTLLEMGYGTGLNFLLTHLNAGSKIIDYEGIELFPLEENLINQLNYPELLNLDKQQTKDFFRFHSAIKEGSMGNIHYKKLNTSLADFDTQSKYDLVYFDAFAPQIQPELWTQQVFEKLFNLMNVEGILCTYCAKGQVRRNMINAGFKVERLQGPPGKREMLRATK